MPQFYPNDNASPDNCPICGSIPLYFEFRTGYYCTACDVITDSAHGDQPWEKWSPPARRSLLANILLDGIRRPGPCEPGAVRLAAIKNIDQRLYGYFAERDPDKRAWYLAVQESLRVDIGAAEDYAARLIARERLSPEEKAQQKAERTATPPTPAQLWRLGREGYRGAAPETCSEASRMIADAIKAKKAKMAVFSAKNQEFKV